jgi:hypothetical protein
MATPPLRRRISLRHAAIAATPFDDEFAAIFTPPLPMPPMAFSLFVCLLTPFSPPLRHSHASHCRFDIFQRPEHF